MEFFYDKQKYTEETFADTFCDGDLNYAKTVIEHLQDANKIIIITGEKSNKRFEQDMKTQEEYKKVEDIYNQEEAEEYLKRNRRISEQPTHEKITFDFYTKASAENFALSVEKMIKTLEISMSESDGIWQVTVRNITSVESVKLVSLYKTQNIVNSTVKTTDKLTDTVTETVAFAGSNIIAPVTKIGVKSVGKLAKGLLSTVAKVGSGIITTTVETVASTTRDLKDDPEVLKAKVAIKKNLDSLRGLKNNIGAGSSGIHYN